MIKTYILDSNYIITRNFALMVSLVSLLDSNYLGIYYIRCSRYDLLVEIYRICYHSFCYFLFIFA